MQFYYISENQSRVQDTLIVLPRVFITSVMWGSRALAELALRDITDYFSDITASSI